MNPVPRACLCRSSVDQALGVSCWHGSLRGQVWATHTQLHAVLPDITSGCGVKLYYCVHLSFYLCFRPLLCLPLSLCACACCFVPLCFYLSPPDCVFSPLTDCGGPWDSLSTTHSTLQEVTHEPHPNPLLSSHPASAPDSPHQLPLEATVCMADKAPQPTDHSSIRGATGGRSTQQKCISRGQGTPQGSGEVDCGPGDRQPRALPPKAVLGRSVDRRERQRETCSPCCERKGLHTQAMSTVWPWDPYGSMNLNGASLSSGDGQVSLQERLVSRGLFPREDERASGHSGLCCPSKTMEDPPARSAAASPGPWNVPGSDKLPGTLRSWTSTVSR